MRNNSAVLVLVLLLAFLFLALFLRIGYLSFAPPGFTADEAAFGYNAFSILKTGRDEYGNFMPLFFRAFGDYRPPAYVYLSIPFVGLLGLNEFSTRLLSLIVSLLSIILIYKLAFLIFRKEKVAILASFFLAISPWHILLSRMAVMSSLSGFFITLGVFSFLAWLEKNRIFFLSLSFLSFVAAIYSYHNARLTIPLLFLSFLILFFREIKQKRKLVLINFLLVFICLLPLVLVFLKSPEKMLRRGIYQSFLQRGDIEARLQDDRHQDNPQQAPLLTKFFHPRPVYILKEFFRRYLQHFEPNYLFLKGDPHERFQIPGSGIINLALAPPLFYGVLHLLKKKEKKAKVLLAWLLISPLVASQGINTPNSLHTFDSVVPYQLIIALGFFLLLQVWRQQKLSHRLILGLLFLLLFFFDFYNFALGYFYKVPYDHEYAHFWDYGMKPVVEKVEKLEPAYEKIVFIGRVYHEFLLFYKQYNPRVYQQEVAVSLPDESGFEHVVKFSKYEFTRNWSTTEKDFKTLYIADYREVPEEFFDCPKKGKLFLREKERIYFKDGTIAFRFFDIPENQNHYKKVFCQKR